MAALVARLVALAERPQLRGPPLRCVKTASRAVKDAVKSRVGTSAAVWAGAMSLLSLALLLGVAALVVYLLATLVLPGAVLMAGLATPPPGWLTIAGLLGLLAAGVRARSATTWPRC